MWFKSVQIFKTNFHQIESERQAILNQAAAFQFKPCGKHEISSVGWIDPAGTESENLIYESHQCWLLALKVQEKVVPQATINEQVAERVKALEEETGKRISKREQAAIKDDVFHQLLPLAFTRNKTILGYLDAVTGLLVINATQVKLLDQFVHFLNKSFAKLHVEKVQTQDIGLILTGWLLSQQYPESFVIEDTCVLQDSNEDSLIRCQRENLLSEEIINLLEAGRQVQQLSLSWQDQIRFTINADLQLKGIKFLEILQDQAKDIHTETEEERFDADLSIMVAVFREWLSALLQLFEHTDAKPAQAASETQEAVA